MPSISIPMPPIELRQMVGPTDPRDFDNPRGDPIYQDYGLPLDCYETVFDFGCGCGRIARQLLQQQPKPSRYVGIDIHRGMVDWCRQNLSPIDARYQFFHHDVYSPAYAPQNSLRLSEPFPVPDGEFSLLIAHSVFTHLCRQQTEYYLGEVARILSPQGVAFTSWFFFDNDSFPFLSEGPFSLHTSEADFSQAVIYDRAWFIKTLRRLELRVRSTTPPSVPGHQWAVFIEKRARDLTDQFPLGEEGAEWLCGATLKRIPAPANPPKVVRKPKEVPAATAGDRPQAPSLFGALAELDTMRRSRAWRIGRAITAPGRALKKLLLH